MHKKLLKNLALEGTACTFSIHPMTKYLKGSLKSGLKNYFAIAGDIFF